jgi:hypothetical protein
MNSRGRLLPARAGPAVSCDPAGLHVLAYAAGFTLWHYRTDVALDEIARPGYFNPAKALLRPGDRIAVNSNRNGRFAAARDYCVLAVRPADVLLAPMTEATAAP